MTALLKRKTRLQFETAARYGTRAIVVECLPQVALIRLKGTGTVYTVDWSAVYTLAAKLKAMKR